MNDDTYIPAWNEGDPLEDAFCEAVRKAFSAIHFLPPYSGAFADMTSRDWDALRAYAESRLREIDGPEF